MPFADRCIAAGWSLKKLLHRTMASIADPTVLPEIVQAGEMLAESLSGRRHFVKLNEDEPAAEFDPRSVSKTSRATV